MGLFNYFKKKTSSNDNHIVKDARKAECPYCRKALEKIPARKTKCPHCGKFMFVRTDPTSKTRVLVTEKQAKIIEKQWAQMQFIGRWKAVLSDDYGVVEGHFRIKKEALSKRFGQEAGDNDVIWGIFNDLLVACMRTSDYQKMSGIHYRMALFINESGRDCFYVLESSKEDELKALRQFGIKKVKISSAKGVACMKCQEQNGKEFSIEEALEKMPLPCKGCSFKFEPDRKPFCRCMYLTVAE